jgi:hypothetical protein
MAVVSIAVASSIAAVSRSGAVAFTAADLSTEAVAAK